MTEQGDDRNRRRSDRQADAPSAPPWGPGDEGSIVIAALASFEIINAAYGRDVGDALVNAAAARIEEAVAAVAVRDVLREGAVFTVALGTAAAAAQAAVLAIEAALSRPFAIGGRTIHVGSRIGVAQGAAGETREALTERARMALAEARIADGATTRIAAPAPELPLTVLAADLHRAIERGEIVVLFQPQVSFASGAITGVEGLARWNHPTLGALGAETLLAATERADLGPVLSDHILGVALAQVAGWPEALAALRVAVNVTAADIARADFAERFLARVDASGVARARITAEITEGGLIDDLDAATGLLTTLREAGCRVAVDDFGTGYSSLAYLAALPLDYLKIDRQLTQRIEGDRRHRVVVEGVIAIAHALGLETIAEGVETPAQREALAARGCTYYQGFLCAEPLGDAGLVALVEEGAWR